MKENTRQKLIDITFEEIFSKGYQGASLADILNKANVHKGSMYHYFKSKKEMALISIEEKMDEKFFQRYGTILNQKNNYLKSMFDAMKDTSQRDFKRGCPIANIVQEMSNLDEDFNLLMKKIYTKFRENIKNILDKAIEAKEIKNCDSSKLALYISAVLEGAILAAKATGETKDYLDCIEILENHIDNFK